MRAVSRSAGKDALDENTPLVGAPAVARYVAGATSSFYFAIVTRELSPIGSGLFLRAASNALSVSALGHLRKGIFLMLRGATVLFTSLL